MDQASLLPVAVLRGGRGGGGGGGTVTGGRHANLHSTPSKPYVDQEMDIRTFYVTQERENPTDSAYVFCGFTDSRTHTCSMSAKKKVFQQ